jgi:hypothetical protein
MHRSAYVAVKISDSAALSFVFTISLNCVYRFINAVFEMNSSDVALVNWIPC